MKQNRKLQTFRPNTNTHLINP